MIWAESLFWAKNLRFTHCMHDKRAELWHSCYVHTKPRERDCGGGMGGAAYLTSVQMKESRRELGESSRTGP